MSLSQTGQMLEEGVLPSVLSGKLEPARGKVSKKQH
jgi:hypothetical protein